MNIGNELGARGAFSRETRDKHMSVIISVEDSENCETCNWGRGGGKGEEGRGRRLEWTAARALRCRVFQRSQDRRKTAQSTSEV